MGREGLDRIRRPGKISGIKEAGTIGGVLALGILLGVFSKWLDSLALDSAIGWHRLLEALDLGNFFSDLAIWLLAALLIALLSASPLLAALHVFLFFAGMCAAYHLYSVLVCGFNPSSYMMIWYGITLVSPLPAVLCWYARGKGPAAFVLTAGILAVFIKACFAIGFLYMDIRGILYLLVFAAAAASLFQSPRQILSALALAFPLALVSGLFWPFS